MKYLRRFKSESDYQEFMGGGEYIEPHVVTIEVGASKPVMKYKKYVKPEVSPLIGGVTLNDMGSVQNGLLEDTAELGKEVYQYLYKKCGNGTVSATYYLTENEALYCQKKWKTGMASGPYLESTMQVFVVIYEEITTPQEVFSALALYSTNPNSKIDFDDDPNEVAMASYLYADGTVEFGS